MTRVCVYTSVVRQCSRAVVPNGLKGKSSLARVTNESIRLDDGTTLLGAAETLGLTKIKIRKTKKKKTATKISEIPGGGNTLLLRVFPPPMPTSFFFAVIVRITFPFRRNSILSCHASARQKRLLFTGAVDSCHQANRPARACALWSCGKKSVS